MKDVTFSVIIPTCHRNDFLKKCLACLAPDVQTLSSGQYEVIVTDDGHQSTAQNMLAEEFPWVRWLAGPRRGPAANRNNGAKSAKGEYLVFTDDDCLPSAGWLAAFAEAVSPNTCVYEGKTTCQAGLNSPLEQAPINVTGGYLWSCNMMVESATFFRVGGFDEAFPYPAMEDVDFRERLKNKGFTFPFVEHAIVDHPPRRSVGGKRLGAMWESNFYFYVKSGEYKGDIRLYILNKLMDQKIHLLLKAPLCRDTPAYILSIFIEFLHVLFHLNSWTRKYRSLIYK